MSADTFHIIQPEEDLQVENLPFFNPENPPAIKGKDPRNEHKPSSNKNSFKPIESNLEIDAIKTQDNSHTKSQPEKRNKRLEILNNETQPNEFKSLLDNLKKKVSKIESEKENEKKTQFISIPKNELVEINYSRILLEKEIARLKESLLDKEKEISDLKSIIEPLGLSRPEDFPLQYPDQKRVPLKDLTSKSFIRDNKNQVHPGDENFLNTKENSLLKKQLHDSLKINDRLNVIVRELQEKLKIKDFETEKFRSDPNTRSATPARRYRTSSYSIPTHLNSPDLEFQGIKSELEISYQKIKELNDLVSKSQTDIENSQTKIENLEKKLIKKKETILDQVKIIENLNSQLDKMIEHKIFLEKNIIPENIQKNIEKALFNKENEMKVEIDQKKSDILSLTRSLELLKTEKHQFESKLKDFENIKKINTQLSNSFEQSKSAEIKLIEEISVLRNSLNQKDSQLSTAQTRLTSLQSFYQSLESDFSASSKKLEEKEKKLFDLTEKNSKISKKLAKKTSKLESYKYQKTTNYADLKDLTNKYIIEKDQVSKLLSQNSELKSFINSLEDTRNDFIGKAQDLKSKNTELATKLRVLEDEYCFIKTLNHQENKKVNEGYEKTLAENSALKSDLKKKNEEYIISKAENRKLTQELNEAIFKLKKSQEQEDFTQQLMKTSDQETKRISEKLLISNKLNDEKDSRLSQLNSEIFSANNQISALNEELKRLENSIRSLNLENYSLQSKIEELDKIKSDKLPDNKLQDEYYKIFRAYQHLSDDYKTLSMSINESKASRASSDIFRLKKYETSPSDEVCYMNEIEKLQIKLQGSLEENANLQRKLEFISKEKQELQNSLKDYEEKFKFHDQNSIKSENIFKEVMKYKNETIKLELDQNKLRKELEHALSKLQSAKNKAKSLEESLMNKKIKY